MAEALRVASSIIAVVGASIKTTETILGLISLYRDAPVEVSFLKNDVADTQIILSSIKENISSIRHVEHRPGLTDSDAVWCNLQNNDKACFLLRRLELSLIEIEETLRMIESKFKDNTIIDRATWMMHRNKIKTLRANLREQKDNIILYFSGSSSTQASRNFVLLTKVLCENSQNTHQEGQRHNHLDALLQNMSRSLAALSTISERQTQLIALLENFAPSVVTLEQRTTDTTSSQTIKNKSNIGKPDETPTAGAARSLPQLSPVPDTSSIQVSTESISRLKLELSRFQKRGCVLGCEYHCHQRRRYRSPSFAQKILGEAFVAFSSIPLLSRPCDNGCMHKSRFSFNFTYYLPTAFLNKMVSLVYMTTTQGDLAICIKVRPLSTDFSIYRAIEKCDVGGIHKMLEGRLVHPSASFKG